MNGLKRNILNGRNEMGKSTYLKKRMKSGLSKTDVAKELGISYRRYNLIEGGDVKMPSNLIDKFNEIINRGKENKIISLENGRDADKMWEELSAKNELGVAKIYEKLDEFNIPNVKTLAQLIGYKSAGTIYNYLLKPESANDEFKKKLYLFFSNELNIQEPYVKSVRSIKGGYHSSSRVPELVEYYNETNFKELLKAFNMTNKELAIAVNISTGVISRLVNKKSMPSDRVLVSIKKFFENKEEIENDNAIKTTMVVDTQDTYICEKEPSVVKKYKDELNEVNDMIDYYTKLIATYEQEITHLAQRKEICTEILGVIDSLRNGE